MSQPRQQVTRVAAYGLVVQENRILLCRISSRLPLDAGLWTLPGGGIDFGEEPAAAMVREVHEETGLQVQPLDVAGVDSFYVEEPHRAFHGIRIIYRTEIVGGSLRNEIDGTTDLCAWWTQDEAQRLPLVDLAVKGLERIIMTDQIDRDEERLPPIHPGEILLEDFMKPLGLSQYRLAQDLGVPALRISQIVHGKRAITADTALRLARYFGTSAAVWMRLQARYELEIAETELAERVQREVRVRNAAAPVPV